LEEEGENGRKEGRKEAVVEESEGIAASHSRYATAAV
jgi:hypothetical protein